MIQISSGACSVFLLVVGGVVLSDHLSPAPTQNKKKTTFFPILFGVGVMGFSLDIACHETNCASFCFWRRVPTYLKATTKQHVPSILFFRGVPIPKKIMCTLTCCFGGGPFESNYHKTSAGGSHLQATTQVTLGWWFGSVARRFEVLAFVEGKSKTTPELHHSKPPKRTLNHLKAKSH